MFSGTWSANVQPSTQPTGTWGSGGGGSTGTWGSTATSGGSTGTWSYAPAPSYSYPSSYAYTYSMPALAPYVAPGAGLSFGPYGEGAFTPYDFPLMRPLREGERLGSNGIVAKLAELSPGTKLLLAGLAAFLVFKK
jgi:hypothetical protein